MRFQIIFSWIVLFFAISGQSQDNYENLIQKAEEYHRSFVTVDSHTDTPLWFLSEDYNFGERHHPGKSSNKIDLPRMEEGGLDAVFLAAFVGQGKRTPEGHQKAYLRAHRIIDSIETVASRHSEKAEIATTPQDASRLKNEGKKALYIGMENGYPLNRDIKRIEEFYKRGVRYITLSHTKNNEICDSSTDTLEHGGLSDFGENVVKEMNRLGVMIDVSHISDSAFYDVIQISQTPVIASHSNARALRDHPRNLSDDMLKAIAKNNGVVQVCVLSDYVKDMPPDPERDSAMRLLRKKFNGFDDLTEEEQAAARRQWQEINQKYPAPMAHLTDLADHIDHIAEVAGIDHVGIGTDFDGGGALNGVYDGSELKNITVELIRRGYSYEDIQKIWSGNFFRVFSDVIKHAEEQNEAS
ncbi:MAG: dipeptidase [Bacteroidota bacterium]